MEFSIRTYPLLRTAEAIKLIEKLVQCAGSGANVRWLRRRALRRCAEYAKGKGSRPLSHIPEKLTHDEAGDLIGAVLYLLNPRADLRKVLDGGAPLSP